VPNRPKRPKTNNRIFYIDATNKVSLVNSGLPNRTAGATFSSERELSVRVARWPGSRLLQVWNRLPQVTRVKRFTDRPTAIRRLWRAIQEGRFNQIAGAGTQEVTLKKALGANTKTARVIDLLRRPEGSTLQSIMDLTGWQAHSVRGFLSAQLSKKRGLRIESFTSGGQRVYRIHS
jgi:hypothetical protein